MLPACDSVEEGGVLTQRSRENVAVSEIPYFKTSGCYFYRSHTQSHTQATSCFLFQPNTLHVNKHHSRWKPCHRFEPISLACPSATSTSQWVIVPITPHFLSSEGLSCVVAARVQYPAAWHSTHYGLMEVKVFLWLSLAHSASQVPHKTLSEGLITNVHTRILTDTHIHTSR